MCNFNTIFQKQLCWNRASAGSVPLSVSVLGTPYHGMSLRDCFQTHCTVNVNISVIGPDDKTIVFCRSLETLNITITKKKLCKTFRKIKDGKKSFFTISTHFQRNTSKVKCIDNLWQTICPHFNVLA